MINPQLCFPAFPIFISFHKHQKFIHISSIRQIFHISLNFQLALISSILPRVSKNLRSCWAKDGRILRFFLSIYSYMGSQKPWTKLRSYPMYHITFPQIPKAKFLATATEKAVLTIPFKVYDRIKGIFALWFSEWMALKLTNILSGSGIIHPQHSIWKSTINKIMVLCI